MSGLSADLIDEMPLIEDIELDGEGIEPRWPVVTKPRKPGTWDREQARYWATVNQARRRNLRRLREGEHGSR